mmetsp:Transcript_19481/g.74760  ORF Transcript_19481/g.74760 Transcript_19481/m.74760 type:complete len:290 (-) Transcript_19481:79-948(-)
MGQEVSKAGAKALSVKGHQRKVSKGSLNALPKAIHESLRAFQEQNSFSQVEVTKMYQIFEEESNGNGSLERCEFQRALQRLEDFGLPLYADLPMGLRLFDLFDKNEDGVVDVKEFIAGFSVLCKGTDEDKLDLTFQVFDKDGSGYITQEELLDMYLSTYHCLMLSMRATLTPPEFADNEEANLWQDKIIAALEQKFEEKMRIVSQAIVKRLDENDDGRLSRAEFKRFVYANPFVKAEYKLNFTLDTAGEDPVQNDERLTSEVLLSFLAPAPEGGGQSPRELTLSPRSSS